VTSSYVAANTQTSRVIYGGARGGLWARTLAEVSPKFRTPARAAIAFVAPSILIGVMSTIWTGPGTAAGFLGTYGILGLILMYVMANVAMVAHWAKSRGDGRDAHLWTWLIVPLVGIAVLGIPVWGDLQPGQAAPFKYLPWLTIALIAVGVTYMLILQAVRPDVMVRAPALLEGAEIEAEREAGAAPSGAPKASG
jgi:amino acid transporter